jgi:hypothetical protein
MKVITAAKERLLNLANPQIPCPEVHPLPSLVPKPTKNPATIYPRLETIGMRSF